MIYRTWICLNRYCLRENTVADADHPPCPYCGGLRVKWVPKPVATMSQRTRNIDATVREIIATNGDKNWNSPVRDGRAAPKVNPSLGSHTTQFSPAGMLGWTGTVPVDPKTGAPLAACVNTSVTAPLSAPIGRAHTGSQRLKPVPSVEARHGTSADIQRMMAPR